MFGGSHEWLSVGKCFKKTYWTLKILREGNSIDWLNEASLERLNLAKALFLPQKFYVKATRQETDLALKALNGKNLHSFCDQAGVQLKRWRKFLDIIKKGKKSKPKIQDCKIFCRGHSQVRCFLRRAFRWADASDRVKRVKQRQEDSNVIEWKVRRIDTDPDKDTGDVF